MKINNSFAKTLIKTNISMKILNILKNLNVFKYNLFLFYIVVSFTK